MSKTYTLESTYVYPCQYSSASTRWRSTRQAVTSYARCGYDGSNHCYVQYIFDQTTLASLRSKTITSITLKIYCADTFPPVTQKWGFYLDYAYYSTTYSSAYRGNAAGTASSDSDNIGSVDGSGTQVPFTRSGSYYIFDLTNYTLAGMGYMLGQNGSSQKILTVDTKQTKTKAVLTVVTNETDYNYTLTYNANGGSGAPSNQTGSNTQVNPSYTFTISSTVPTRAGYEFLGWSTSSSATTASYQPGDTITVTTGGTTTLYAVWKMLNTIRVVNSQGNLELYMVYSVDSNLVLQARRVMVVNSGGTLDTYT